MFQGLCGFQHIGADPNVRDRWDHPLYQACADSCADYDQNSFDPDNPTESLEFFEPMVRRVFDPSRVKKPDTWGWVSAGGGSTGAHRWWLERGAQQ